MFRTTYPPLKLSEELTPLTWLAAELAAERPARKRRWFRRPRPVAPVYEPYISTSLKPARGDC